ncbi:MAG: hypothetical protein LBF81_07580 [Prevotellaceae bacterium]|jgi:hypothetical protein|nr:hypothetical protein [Prevotellaceae bacterium]
MKKIIFFFALLASMTASAAVTVTPLSVDYATRKVTFSVSWTGSAANNRVWVWVDLCPVAGTTAGAFAKAELSNPSAITGGISTVTGNTRGFYVTTNPSTVTAVLSNATGKFNWCAYGSDYPPNAKDNSSGGYTLRGTLPFIVTTSAGTTEVKANTYSGGTITALTDATGCPGVWCGKNGEAPGLLDCCATGTTNCSGTCKTNGTYTTNDGACASACKTAYKRVRNQCGVVVSTSSETYSNSSCYTNCTYANSCAGCKQFCTDRGTKYASLCPGRCRCSDVKCPNACFGCAIGAADDYTYKNNTWNYSASITAKDAWDCTQHTWCN